MNPKKIVSRLLFATIAFGAVTTACSLVVSNDTVQCSKDSDCATFGTNAVCSAQVCVGRAACIPKTPTTQLDILNEPCTNATCTPFDDCATLGLCNDAGLPALIVPPDGGVR